MPDAISIEGQGEPERHTAGRDGSRPPTFAALVERHSQFVFRVALAVTRDPHDAEDVVQETFLQVYRGERWKKMEDERGYLARVVWRLAVRQRKPRARERELPLEMPGRGATPEQSAIDRQMQSWLHGRIDALPEKLRQPLALLALGELKLVEIAGILGLPEGTVRRRVYTARQLLKQELVRRKGGTDD